MSDDILQLYVKKMRCIIRGQKRNEGPAPHKPLLLLAVIDLISQGYIKENKIELSPSLAETFKKYWFRVTDRTLNIAMPFYHLKREKFWHLYPKIGKEEQLNSISRIRSLRVLHEIVDYASLDNALYILLTDPQTREIIRQTLINSYFPEAKQQIQKLIQEEHQIGEYRQLLLLHIEEHPFSLRQGVELNINENPIRSAAFRREIMRIYNYTCVVCQSRIITMEGESITEAAHIIPFTVSQNDDVRNGISLCKLHHWAFDKGLISFSKTYKTIVTEHVSEEGPEEWMLTELRNRRMLLPKHKMLYPAQDALEWHREEVYRR